MAEEHHARESVKKNVEYDDGQVKRINQYELGAKLGQGSFAEVFRAKSDDKGLISACKVFNKSLLRRKRTMTRTGRGVEVHNELEKVEKEVAIMKKLEHDHLVRLYEVIDDVEDDALYLFMEYVELGPVLKAVPP